MIVDFPARPIPAEIEWRLRQPSQANRSEFTGRRRVTILPEAPRWSARVTYPPIIGEVRFRPWRAALARLKGRANAFRLYATEQAQWGLGSPLVDGAGQFGSVLSVRGCFNGARAYAGWFVTIAGGLHQVTQDSKADATGNLQLHIEPCVAMLADGEPIEAVRPYAVVSLTEDEAGWTVGRGQVYSVSLSVEEAR